MRVNSFSVQLNEGLYDPGIFKAFFLAGGPGSGKTYVTTRVTGGMGLKNVNSDIKINHWKEEYTNLFNSIIVEKYLYSLFGLFIILISNFTFIIITSSTLLNKIKVLGILQVIGFNKYIINK